MANISKIKLPNSDTIYNIVDSEALRASALIEMELITPEDIDAICNQNFQSIENLTDEIDQYASLNDELEAVVDEMSGSIVE